MAREARSSGVGGGGGNAGLLGDGGGTPRARSTRGGSGRVGTRARSRGDGGGSGGDLSGSERGDRRSGLRLASFRPLVHVGDDGGIGHAFGDDGEGSFDGGGRR